MADKQIGIKLDVKSTGLQQVDDSLETISKNLQSMNADVMKQQQRGWGSEAQTKELREQLRTMQQMLQASERIARTNGVHSDSFGNYRQEINSMQRDLADLRTYRSTVGGRIQDRFGSGPAKTVDKALDYGGKAAALYGSFDILSTIKQGLSTGTQLAYGYGDLSKRMVPNTPSAIKWGIDLSNKLQGYGYDDMSIMQNATQYAATTGRMDTGKFADQLRAIEQVGRSYGLDLSSVTQNFSAAYQNGVTGGSGAQMSPQEYANLVANAVNRGNMQGREATVMQQMQQMMQSGAASTGKAGDATQIASILDSIYKSGNQALINQAPNLMQGINNGMMNPGGGYAGQMLMMGAINPNRNLSYWQQQMVMGADAFTKLDELGGKSKIEVALPQLVKELGGKDNDQLPVMLGQLFGMNPNQLKTLLPQIVDKNGNFLPGGEDALKALQGQSPNIPQNDADQVRNNNQSKDHAANGVGQQTAPERSWLNSIAGSVISAVGGPLVDLGMIAMGAKGAKSLWDMGSGAVRMGRRIGGKLTGKSATNAATSAEESVATTSEATATEATAATEAAATGEGVGTATAAGAGEAAAVGAGEAAVDVGLVGGIETAGLAADATGVGLPVGIALGLIGAGIGGFELWKHHNQQQTTSSTSKSTHAAVYGPPIPTSPSSSDDSNAGVNDTIPTGAELAPIVASTIVALGPYMGQIKPLLSDASNTTATNDLVARGNQNSFSDLVLRQANASNPWGGLTNLSYQTGVNSMMGAPIGGGGDGGLPSGTYSGSAADTIAYWSQQYGVPSYIGQAIAMAESSMNPNASGDGGTSWGLFQLHQNGGQGTGYTADQLKDPNLNAKIGMQAIANAYKQAPSNLQGADLAEWVAEHSGHPGYGAHTGLDDAIYNNAKGILGGTIKFQDATVTVNVKTGDQTQSVPVKLKPEMPWL